MTVDPNEVERRAQNKMIPLGSTFHNLFSGGASVWLKILGGAIVMPVVALKSMVRGNHQGAMELSVDPIVITIIFGACVILGGFLGAALSLKDIVQDRLDTDKPVSFPMKLLFEFGLWSLLLVWFPGVFVITLLMTVLVLI